MISAANNGIACPAIPVGRPPILIHMLRSPTPASPRCRSNSCTGTCNRTMGTRRAVRHRNATRGARFFLHGWIRTTAGVDRHRRTGYRRTLVPSTLANCQGKDSTHQELAIRRSVRVRRPAARPGAPEGVPAGSGGGVFSRGPFWGQACNARFVVEVARRWRQAGPRGALHRDIAAPCRREPQVGKQVRTASRIRGRHSPSLTKKWSCSTHLAAVFGGGQVNASTSGSDGPASRYGSGIEMLRRAAALFTHPSKQHGNLRIKRPGGRHGDES